MPSTWNEARSDCMAFGADLATVPSKEERELLIKHLEAFGKDDFTAFFLGAQKEGNKLKWINGDLLSCAEPFQNVCSPNPRWDGPGLTAVSDHGEIRFSKTRGYGEALCEYYV